MALIYKQIKLKGSKGEREATALFDSGSSYSIIRKDIATEIAPLDTLPDPKEFEIAETGKKLTAREYVRADFYIGGYGFSDEFMVIETLSEDVIIGALTLQKWRIKLDCEKEDVIIDPRVTRLKI